MSEPASTMSVTDVGTTMAPVLVGGGGPAPGGNKRVFVLLGVGAALVLAALVVPRLLFGGEDEGTADVVPLEAQVDTVPATASPAPPPPTDESLEAIPETFEVFATKNPFAPLVASTPAPEPTDAAEVASISTPSGDALPAPSSDVLAPVVPTPSFVAPAPIAPVGPTRSRWRRACPWPAPPGEGPRRPVPSRASPCSRCSLTPPARSSATCG